MRRGRTRAEGGSGKGEKPTQLQVLDFSLYTCPPCRSMASMVHGLEAKYFGRIKFTYLDADDSRTQGFQRALGFRYQPEFYLLDAGGQLLKKFGLVSPAVRV